MNPKASDQPSNIAGLQCLQLLKSALHITVITYIPNNTLSNMTTTFFIAMISLQQVEAVSGSLPVTSNSKPAAVGPGLNADAAGVYSQQSFRQNSDGRFVLPTSPKRICQDPLLQPHLLAYLFCRLADLSPEDLTSSQPTMLRSPSRNSWILARGKLYVTGWYRVHHCLSMPSTDPGHVHSLTESTYWLSVGNKGI